MIPEDSRPFWWFRFRVACDICEWWHVALALALRNGLMSRPCGEGGCHRVACWVFPVADKVFEALYLCEYHGRIGARELRKGLEELGLEVPKW